MLLEIFLCAIFAILTFFLFPFALRATNKLFHVENNTYRRALRVIWLPFALYMVIGVFNYYVTLSSLVYYALVIATLIFFSWLVMGEYDLNFWNSFLSAFISGILLSLWIGLLIFVFSIIFTAVIFSSFDPSQLNQLSP